MFAQQQREEVGKKWVPLFAHPVIPLRLSSVATLPDRAASG
jgi:hypothetical protein